MKFWNNLLDIDAWILIRVEKGSQYLQRTIGTKRDIHAGVLAVIALVAEFMSLFVHRRSVGGFILSLFFLTVYAVGLPWYRNNITSSTTTMNPLKWMMRGYRVGMTLATVTFLLVPIYDWETVDLVATYLLFYMQCVDDLPDCKSKLKELMESFSTMEAQPCEN